MNIHPCCRGYPNSQVAQQFCDRTSGEDRLRAGAKCVNPWEWGDDGISTAKYGWDLTTSTQDLIEISPLSLWLQVKTLIRFDEFWCFPKVFITRSSPDFPRKTSDLCIFSLQKIDFSPTQSCGGVIFGGVAAQQQTPMEAEPDFGRWPEVLVATPGRYLDEKHADVGWCG